MLIALSYHGLICRRAVFCPDETIFARILPLFRACLIKMSVPQPSPSWVVEGAQPLARVRQPWVGPVVMVPVPLTGAHRKWIMAGKRLAYTAHGKGILICLDKVSAFGVTSGVAVGGDASTFEYGPSR